MKKDKLLLVCFVVLALAVYFSLNHSTYKSPKTPIEGQEYYVQVTKTDGSVESIELEEYVIGVVAGEMPASFEKEALKAQAVATRTFVLSRDLVVDTTTSSQVYLDIETMKSNWGSQFDEYYHKIKAAVNETKSLVLTYQGDYISALFFSTSNGKTENNEDYFNSVPVAYLRSVDSHWDLTISDKIYQQKEFSISELKNIFNVTSLSFSIINYKDSGRVDSVNVSGTVYTGREIREKLGLSSNDFEILENGDSYIFSTTGFGHGVGMSQYGAQGMALEGYLYNQILEHYYSGVEITKLD